HRSWLRTQAPMVPNAPRRPVVPGAYEHPQSGPVVQAASQTGPCQSDQHRGRRPHRAIHRHAGRWVAPLRATAAELASRVNSGKPEAMADATTDRALLTEQAYADSANLRARQSIYDFKH